MKKVLLLLALSLTTSYGFSQSSKFYVGVSAGLASIGELVGENLETGFNAGWINLGYKFHKNWGVAANFSTSINKVESDFDLMDQVKFNYAGIGPMFTFPLHSIIQWEIKPQYTFIFSKLKMEENLSKVDFRGSGFSFNNSFVFGKATAPIQFTLDLGYTIGAFDKAEVEELDSVLDLESKDNRLSNFNVGIGARYQF